MTIFQAIQIALRGLKANPLRSMLTMLGIIIGVAAVITMIAAGSGAQLQVSERFQSLGTNLILVIPGAQQVSGTRLGAGSSHTLTEEDAIALRREISAIALAAPAVSGSIRAVRGNLNRLTTVTGITLDFLQAREWKLASGRHFFREEIDTAGKVALLGATVKTQLFGTDNPLGQTLRLNNIPFTVIGLLQPKGQGATGEDQDNVILIPLTSAKMRLLSGKHNINRRAVDMIVVKVAEADNLMSAEQQITETLRRRHRLESTEENDFSVRNLAELLNARAGSSRTISMFLAAVASISLIVGGISIMNIMLVSVTERTREIGLRLAVGARRRDIRLQFLIEAMTLTTLGGFLGALLGTLAAAGFAQWAGWPMLITPTAISLALTSSTILGVFFGWYPAYKASRLDPIQALRFE